jgi:uroporphyrinogen-III synthase
VRIALTRPELDEELAAALHARGYETVWSPLISLEPVSDEPIDASGYDWLVITSQNGAAEAARRLTGRPRHIAAVGPATAIALRARGFPVDLVPAEASQDGLLAELPRPAGRVLLAAAEGARRLLVDKLGADFVPLYRTRELSPHAFPDADLVVLASPSAARAYARLGAAPVVTIGPQTTEAARAAGLTVAAEAAQPSVGGLTAAIAAAAR